MEFQIGDLARYVQERHVDFSVSNIWLLNLFLCFFMHSHLKLTQSSRRSILMRGISFNSMVHSIVRFQKGIYPMQSIIKCEWLSWKNGGCLIWKLCKCHFFWSCFVNLVGWTTDSIGELNFRLMVVKAFLFIWQVLFFLRMLKYEVDHSKKLNEFLNNLWNQWLKF